MLGALAQDTSRDRINFDRARLGQPRQPFASNGCKYKTARTQPAQWATSHCSRKLYYAVWKAISAGATAASTPPIGCQQRGSAASTPSIGWQQRGSAEHAIDRMPAMGAAASIVKQTQALSPLLIMGVLMLAVGRYDADLETLLPGVTERFEVAVGKAFVEDRDQLNSACSLIGVLKVLVVLNIWGLKNTRVQLILAAIAVPGFALVIYAHMALGDMPSAY